MQLSIEEKLDLFLDTLSEDFKKNDLPAQTFIENNEDITRRHAFEVRDKLMAALEGTPFYKEITSIHEKYGEINKDQMDNFVKEVEPIVKLIIKKTQMAIANAWCIVFPPEVSTDVVESEPVRCSKCYKQGTMIEDARFCTVCWYA